MDLIATLTMCCRYKNHNLQNTIEKKASLLFSLFICKIIRFFSIFEYSSKVRFCRVKTISLNIIL